MIKTLIQRQRSIQKQPSKSSLKDQAQLSRELKLSRVQLSYDYRDSKVSLHTGMTINHRLFPSATHLNLTIRAESITIWNNG
jgi:hypothetical protein